MGENAVLKIFLSEMNICFSGLGAKANREEFFLNKKLCEAAICQNFVRGAARPWKIWLQDSSRGQVF